MRRIREDDTEIGCGWVDFGIARCGPEGHADGGPVSGSSERIEASSPDRYRVGVVKSPEGLAGLEVAWKALCAACDDLPVFVGWDWMSTWWRHFGDRWQLFVLTAHDDADRLVGIAPLVRRRRFVSPVPVRCVRFMANEGAFGSHLDVLADPSIREHVAGAFVAHLFRNGREWDVLDLGDLVAGSTLGTHVRDLPGRRWDCPGMVCPYVTLPDDWETYRRGLTKKVRRNLTYFPALLEREHPARAHVRLVDEPEALQAGIDSLVEMHLRRRADTTFLEESFVRFHRELAATALAGGWLRFHELAVDDRVIAIIYCFQGGDTVYAYQSGFDLDWGRYSPGRQIAAHAIRSAMDEGARVFDWMQGNDDYKYEWTDESRVDYRLLLARNLRGAIWLLVVKSWHGVREMVRHRLERSTRRWIKELIWGLRPRRARG